MEATLYSAPLLQLVVVAEVHTQATLLAVMVVQVVVVVLLQRLILAVLQIHQVKGTKVEMPLAVLQEMLAQVAVVQEQQEPTKQQVELEQTVE
jgi:hypothetical protein